MPKVLLRPVGGSRQTKTPMADRSVLAALDLGEWMVVTVVSQSTAEGLDHRLKF